MLTVHVRVNDAATGKPTPVRIRLVDADGIYRPPLGRLADFATWPAQDVGGNLLQDGKRWSWIDGATEVRLPAGPLTVEVRKGPEYLPLQQEVLLRPGQISLRLAIERWTDLRTEGWYSADVRCHELSPSAALLEAGGEGLAAVSVLAREWPARGDVPPRIPGILDFSGTEAARTAPECVVSVNTLNQHPVLGSVGLLDCHRVVYPLRFGDPEPYDNWSVADWCDQCHRKRGLVTWPDLPRLTETALQGEALACLILGKIDAWELSPAADPDFACLEPWYRLLEAGFRVPLVGASGKDNNTVPLGAVRTYVLLPPPTPFSLADQVHAIRAGCTFVTGDPLLTLEAAGQGPGGVVRGTDGERIRLRATARSHLPFQTLEVLLAGQVLAQQTPAGTPHTATIEAEVPLERSTWLVARCRGSVAQGWTAAAHTSPIYLRLEGRPPLPDPARLTSLLTGLERTREWVERQARCETDRQREHLRGILDAARTRLLEGGGT
jgi:hypothetical protein